MADTQANRSPKEIEAELAATRNRLSRSVDELAYRVSPQNLKANAKAQVQGQVQQFAGSAKGTVVDPAGQPRYQNIAMGLGGLSVAALSLGLLRRAFYRG